MDPELPLMLDLLSARVGGLCLQSPWEQCFLHPLLSEDDRDGLVDSIVEEWVFNTEWALEPEVDCYLTGVLREAGWLVRWPSLPWANEVLMELSSKTCIEHSCASPRQKRNFASIINGAGLESDGLRLCHVQRSGPMLEGLPGVKVLF